MRSYQEKERFGLSARVILSNFMNRAEEEVDLRFMPCAMASASLGQWSSN